MSYDLPWANASNTPFRLYKHWVHEGGISTPFIVSWPSVIRESRISHQPIHFVDIMATCIDAAGAEYPREQGGTQLTPLEGESLIPAFVNSKWKRQKPILWEHEGNCAVRDGEWKLVKKHPGDWELYNMNDDRTELNDLALENRPVRDGLVRVFDEWSERCDIVPWDQIGPKQDPWIQAPRIRRR
jgi:arylsulfatase